MMAYIGGFLRLLLVFLVVCLTNWYACQAADVHDELSQNVENIPSSFHMLHHQQQQKQRIKRESPNSRFFVNHLHRVPLSLGSSSLSDRVADSISHSVLRFGLEVGTQLSENAYYSKSEIFSPLSVMTALSLLLAGAKGKSYQQLKPIFGFDLDDELQRSPQYAELLHKEFGDLLQDIEKHDLKALHHQDNAKWRDTPVIYNIRGNSASQNENVVHIIKVANGLFAQAGYNLNLNYRNVITSIYGSEMVQLDFHHNNEEARQQINDWVLKNTYGKIKNIISNAIPQSTNMILATVLYFKGFWENTFFEAATSLDNFYPEGENKAAIKVPMMVTGGVFPFYEAIEHGCRIIGLPYKGNLTTMYVIQPSRDSSRENLKKLQSKITAEIIEDMISKMAYRTALVAFPKMHIERQLNMKDILRNFGVRDIFSSISSDLSLIGGIGSNTVPNIVQSALPIIPINHKNNIPKNIKELMFRDRYNGSPLFFSNRFGTIGNDTKINKTAVANETATEASIANKTISSAIKGDASTRKRRQALINTNPLSLLEAERLVTSNLKSDLYVEDILHKVDFEVNEQGTEAAAATLTYLRRSGTDVIFRADTPFILLIRHDPSKLVLFYGIVNEPET